MRIEKMRLLYTIGIWLYGLGVRVAALFGHRNARLMLHGWNHWREELQKLDSRPVVWFHVASLGEFEQARPVLERYHEMHPDRQVLLTFFSPSGYEVRKNYPQAQAVCYLPPDLPVTVNRFVKCIGNLQTVFFVKYDFWFNYLDALRLRGVPTYIFSTIFRPTQYFFKTWGCWFLEQLDRCFTHIFVQNDESLQLLKNHAVEHCSLAGDTRFDRVHQIAVSDIHNEVVEHWLGDFDGKVMVCGSTWPPDEELIKECVSALMSKCVSADATAANTITQSHNNAIRLIIAPHVINEEHLQAIEKLFPDSVRYSKCVSDNDASATNTITQSHNNAFSRVLIIDNIGLLSQLYRYADVAYIGGGFGVGIHNTLEAITFGKPVLFGPNYHKFKEARDIVSLGGGFCHNDADTMRRNLEPLLIDPAAYRRASESCSAYMQANLGSTDKIIKKISEK